MHIDWSGFVPRVPIIKEHASANLDQPANDTARFVRLVGQKALKDGQCDFSHFSAISVYNLTLPVESYGYIILVDARKFSSQVWIRENLCSVNQEFRKRFPAATPICDLEVQVR